MKQVMKAVVAMVLCMTAVSATAGEVTEAPDLMPVKLLAAPKHKPVKLVRKGKPLAVVYVAVKKPSRRLKSMVGELVKSVKLTAGAELTVVTEMPAAKQTAIIIGDCEETRKAGIDAAKIPIDGFEIKTAPERLYLVGSTVALLPGSSKYAYYHNNGAAWAISDFLERFVGVRWFWSLDFGGRSVLKNRDLVVAPVNYADAPAFRKRVYFPDSYGKTWYSTCVDKLYNLVDPESKQPPVPAAWKDAPKKLKMTPCLTALREGNSWPYLIKVHQPYGTLINSVPDKKIMALVKDAPWWKWQKENCPTNLIRNKSILCYSSQGAFDYILSACENAWDKGKGSSWVTLQYLSISPGDEPMGCHCAECLKHYDADSPQIGAASGHASKTLGLFVKKACEEVTKRWPGKKVMYLPYWNYTLCPEDIDFPDNLEIEVCNSATFRYNEKSTREGIEKNLRAWSKKLKGRKFTSWEYSGWGTLPTHAPTQYPHLLQDFYRKNGHLLAGTFINGGNSPEWHKCAPTMYVWMRIMWNPEINVDASLDAMCERQFGKGAKTARALLQLMCDRWEGIETKHIMFPDWGKFDDKIFNEAYPPKVVDQMEKLYRQAREEMKDDAEALARFDFWNYSFESFLKEARTVRVAKKEE